MADFQRNRRLQIIYRKGGAKRPRNVVKNILRGLFLIRVRLIFYFEFNLVIFCHVIIDIFKGKNIHNYVCLFVTLINVKMAEPIRPKFCVGPSWPQGRFITNQNFQTLNPNKIKFSFGFKNHDFFENPRIFFFTK